MLYSLFPLALWLATLTSASLLFVLWRLGEFSPRTAALVLALFLIAAACQFFGRTLPIAAAGFVIQTLLAVSLIVRWKLAV